VVPTAVALALAVAACGGSSTPRAATTTARATTSRPDATTSSMATTTTTRAPTPPPQTAAREPFSGTVATVTAADLASTYRAGCPVGPASLRMLHMSYWGFDDRAHVGAMVVNAAVTQSVLTVFATLFRAHFPIRRMVPVAAYGGNDQASMAADNTSGFNCRYVQYTNPPQWSVHAYGEAIDVNTVENPYVVAGTVQPPAGRAFLDRSRLGPGMAGPGTVLNDAFASIGWSWGGRFRSPDYQHFSKTGS
jgi:D-alanyl-D-alanine carboxypeptidase